MENNKNLEEIIRDIVRDEILKVLPKYPQQQQLIPPFPYPTTVPCFLFRRRTYKNKNPKEKKKEISKKEHENMNIGL